MTGSSSSSDIDTTAHLGLNTGNFGGLIGSMISDGTIPVHFDHDYSTGNIVGGIQSGGLFGTLATGNGGVVQNSYSTGSVSGAAASHGGAIGFLNNGSGTLDINNIFAHGSVAGGGYVGGLVGELGNAFDPSFNTKITNSYEWGNVSGDSEVGGIVGLSHIDNDDDTNLSEIKNVYASGNVSGTGNTIGGLIGDQEGTALIHYNFYDGATVTGSNPLTYGSLIGYAGTAGVLRNLYYSSSPDGPNPTQCIVHGNGNLNDDACVTKTRADFMGINNTFLSDTVQFDNEATWSFRDGHNPDLAFTTVDDPGVMNMISDVAATPDTTSVVITWTTNDVGSTRVNYGLSAQLGTYTTEKDTSPRVTSHSVTISSLTACTTYHYEVISSDSLSQPHSSGGDKTFKTTGCSTGGDNGGGTGGVVLVPQGGGGGGSWGGGSSSVSTQQQTQQNTQQQQQEDCVAVKLTGSEPFTDEIGHWSHNCVLALYLQNVVQGRAPHLYVPEGTLTRAEAIKIGLLAFGYKTDVTTPSGFTDLNAKAWYVPYLRKAKALGVIGGTKFHPNDAITRADALEIFLKMAKKLDQEPAGPFTDVDQKAEYAGYINYAYAKGVVKGRTPTLFAPQGTITRAEIAKIVVKIQNLK